MENTMVRQPHNVLILGAGELGMAMLTGFIKQRESHRELQLTVLLRPTSLAENASAGHKRRVQQFAEWGVATLAADFSTQSEDELAQVFAPFDAIVNCSGFVGGAGTQLKISRAVLQARVARYFPWQFGVDYDQIGIGSGQPVWDEQLEVRQLLRQQQQTEWVIVSTGMFTSFLFEESFGLVDIPGGKVRALGDANFALTLTTPEDIGLLTAAVFFHQPTLANQVVYIAGDTVTYRQITEILSEHYGREFVLHVEEIASLRAKTQASPEDVSAAYSLAFARADGVSWDKAQTFNARHGIVVTDVKGWLAQNKPCA